jgi:hypothetical protein
LMVLLKAMQKQKKMILATVSRERRNYFQTIQLNERKAINVVEMENFPICCIIRLSSLNRKKERARDEE